MSQASMNSLFYDGGSRAKEKANRAEVVVDIRTPEEKLQQWMEQQLVIEQALVDVAYSMGWTENQVLQHYFINNKKTLTDEENARFAQYHFERGTHGVALRWTASGEHYCVKVDIGTRNPFMQLQHGKGEQDDRVLHVVETDDRSAVNLYESLVEVGQVYLSMFS